MEGIQIRVEKSEINQDISVIHIKGYIDTTTSSELERVIQNLLREERYKIVVDLSEVEYISSAGWGIFISEIKNMRSHSGDLKLCGMSDNVGEVYELLEFSAILSAAHTLADAVKLFSKPGEASSATPAAPLKKPVAVKPAPSAAASTPAPAANPAAAAKPAMPNAKPAISEKVIASSPRVAALVPQPMAAKPAERKPEIFGTPAQAGKPAESILLERVQAVVRRYPSWGAWKIKAELNRQPGNQPKVGWGEVRAELKFNGLKSQADRFKFARGH